MLSCGKHECPSKCHQLSDHSQMNCTKIVKLKCTRNHSLSLPCSQVKRVCRFCVKEDAAKERRRQRELELEKTRQLKQNEYASKLAEAQEEANYLKRLRKDESDEVQRANVLEQYRQVIEDLKNPLKTTTTSIEPEFDDAPHLATSDITETGRLPLHEGRVQGHGNDHRNEPGSLNQMPNKKVSIAQTQWLHDKMFHNSQSPEVDKLMDMIGIESVKEKFLAIKGKVDISIRQNVDITDRFGTVLLGNPGTGKTTVARLYCKFLASMGVIPGDKFIETTGSRLANEGVAGCQKMIEGLLKDGGGTIFIDEAYQLVHSNSFGGAQVLDFLLAEIENLKGKAVFIVAGYQRPMENFFAHNIGLPSRFPHELKFNDFDDSELMQILISNIEKKYNKRMQVENGLGGLYCRIVARRVGKGRGREGFANARAVENALSKISERQSERLQQEKRRATTKVDDFLFTASDMIGPDPSEALKSSAAWHRLQEMVGLASVKKTVDVLMGTMSYNYARELDEKPLVEYSLNRVFLGNPGTGKTSIAKLYGQILVDIGLLSNGEVVVKNPSDFVGSAIGQSEQNTKGILVSTLGKVLVIDEAYGLFAGGTSDGTGAKSDPYRSAVVDTIVAEVQSTPGEDRCVLLLGYKEQMEQMFQNVNPGLSRRFPMDQAFVFEDFISEELNRILDLKLKEQGYGITNGGRRVALEMLERARNCQHFGNAGEIDILLNSAKMCHQKRLNGNRQTDQSLEAYLDAPDFDENFDRMEKNGASLAKLFEGVVGCKDIISKLEGYCQMARNLRTLNMDVRTQLPFNFIFRGPPGTGKTSTARKMGQVYYDMGLLATHEVIETSVTDLVGQYVGQTGPKTQKVLEQTLGKVLFIDEAYRLGQGPFSREAVDELVDCITKPRYAQKLIIILAGYDADINHLMSLNSGLSSRFPESIQFEPFPPSDCIQLLTRLLSKTKIELLESQVEFDITCLENPSPDFAESLSERFHTLSLTASWANARDVGTLAKEISAEVLRAYNGRNLVLGKAAVLQALNNMLLERSQRHKITEVTDNLSPMSNLGKDELQLPFRMDFQDKPVTTMHSQISTHADTASSEALGTTTAHRTNQPAPTTERDIGVTDDVWNQLQKDKASAEAHEKEFLGLEEEEESKQQEILKLREKEAIAARELDIAVQKADDDLQRQYEQARLQHEIERRKKEAAFAEFQAKRDAAAEMRRKEAVNQRKLRCLGVCVAGFRWIKQSGGYRCAGGSHWVSISQLESC
ncbi:Pc12g01870 [Penicillium rubens Wisconsin 54-1255]|uniref:Pc12g01870 protein n=2 Tax=Penicillium chrysogenum species complex TaxID=254878 RepID=B6GZD0_PENRW|nr:Pc12g01870 [Penicillium rubens Wisconsin 54-1255]